VGPLAGIRVVELSAFQQGPAAGMYLADLGAEVIKVEEPTAGDPARSVMGLLGTVMTAPMDGINYYFETHNRGKKSLAVDLRHPEGQALVHRLIARSDVFLSNYLPETLARLGLDPDTLLRHNPRLVYALASGFGPEGPDRDRRAFDLCAQARAGLMSLSAPEGQPPVDLGMGTADQTGGLMLALGIVSALVHRERTGEGQVVNASLLGSALSLHGMWLQAYLFSGTLPRKRPREEARNPFWNLYRAGDGRWFVLSMARSDDVWDGMCRVLGLDSLKEDPRFATHEARMEHSRDLIALLDEVFARWEREPLLRVLESVGVICAPVNTYAEVAQDPQVLANRYITEVDYPLMGRQRVVGTPFHFSRTPAEVRAPAPQLGQHTEEVLLEVLGLDWDALVALKEKGVIPW